MNLEDFRAKLNAQALKNTVRDKMIQSQLSVDEFDPSMMPGDEIYDAIRQSIGLDPYPPSPLEHLYGRELAIQSELEQEQNSVRIEQLQGQQAATRNLFVYESERINLIIRNNIALQRETPVYAQAIGLIVDAKPREEFLEWAKAAGTDIDAVFSKIAALKK